MTSQYDIKCQYDIKSPKDLRRISYIYPLYNNDSFHIVASNHIKYLKNKYLDDRCLDDKYLDDKYLDDDQHIEIEEIDWSQLSIINCNGKRNILIHPFLYLFSSTESFIKNSRNFARLLSSKNKIGGFDVADSNRISKLAVDLINRIDLMIVPSSFAKDVYTKSGVTIPVEILHHGVPDEFLIDDYVYTDNSDIIKLRKMKEHGIILILYFLIHSCHRKGADIVRDVMKKIQSKFDDVYLVVKGTNHDHFSEIKTIYIESWMSNDDLVTLYDTCDICLSPSRGGGFELNALEAISRGVPTLVPNGGCFIDLMDYYIPVNISDKIIQSLPGNPVHIGYGCESDINDFEKKLTNVIKDLEHWKNIFKNRRIEIRERYSWRNIARTLDRHLKNYEFI